MSVKSSRGDFASKHVLSRNLALLLCFASFCAGMFFTNRYFFWLPGALFLALNLKFLLAYLFIYLFYFWLPD